MKPDTLPNQLRRTARWTRVSLLKRSRTPLCEDPFGQHAREGVTIAAEQVHHRKAIHEAPELAFDLDNLMSVCAVCHSRIEQEQGTS